MPRTKEYMKVKKSGDIYQYVVITTDKYENEIRVVPSHIGIVRRDIHNISKTSWNNSHKYFKNAFSEVILPLQLNGPVPICDRIRYCEGQGDSPVFLSYQSWDKTYELCFDFDILKMRLIEYSWVPAEFDEEHKRWNYNHYGVHSKFHSDVLNRDFDFDENYPDKTEYYHSADVAEKISFLSPSEWLQNARNIHTMEEAEKLIKEIEDLCNQRLLAIEHLKEYSLERFYQEKGIIKG